MKPLTRPWGDYLMMNRIGCSLFYCMKDVNKDRKRNIFALILQELYFCKNNNNKKKATTSKGLKSLLMDSLVQLNCTKLLSIGGKIKFKRAELTQMDTLV